MDRDQSTLLATRATGSRRIDSLRYFQFRLSRFRSARIFQTTPDPGQFLLAAAVGKETEVADTHEALRQDVQQKLPDQLFPAQGQDFVPIVIAGQSLYVIRNSSSSIPTIG